MTVIAADAVVFSGDARLRISAERTPRASLADMGLIGKGITVNLEQSTRRKTDAYPEVSAAEVMLAQAAILEATLREWRKETLLPALGLHPSDITEVAAGPRVVTGEAFTLNENRIGALSAQATNTPVIKSGATTLTAGVDYEIRIDLENRMLVVGKGATAIAGATLTADFTALSTGGIQRYKVGGFRMMRYFSVELEEALTNGGKRTLWIPKASISIRGPLDFFTDESSGDTSIRIQAVQDQNLDYLAILENTLPIVNNPNTGAAFIIDPNNAATIYPSNVMYDGGFATTSYAPYQVLDGGAA